MQARFPVWFSKASEQVGCLAPIDLNPCQAVKKILQVASPYSLVPT